MRCRLLLSVLIAVLAGLFFKSAFAESPALEKRLLYVAVPGVPERVEAGLLIYDIDNEHQFVRRIPLPDVDTVEYPLGIKGICANAKTGRLYVTYGPKLACVDLATDELAWTRTYDSGCDRPAITPDGKKLYVPSGYWTETPYWYVVDGATGEVITKIDHSAKAHNTLTSFDGTQAYLAAITSNELAVVDTQTDKIIRNVGPFAAEIRPFTVDGSRRRCYVNVNELLGFEIGDIHTGRKLYRVEVEGFEHGEVRHHGCPSHGIGLSPDEKEVWVVDGANEYVHIFDNTTDPPQQLASVKLSDQPYWITFSIDGRYAYPSTGDVIDTKTRDIVARLKNEKGQRVQSEKMLEVDFSDGQVVRTGDQFGIGRKTR